LKTFFLSAKDIELTGIGLHLPLPFYIQYVYYNKKRRLEITNRLYVLHV